jgi:phospholipid/cholesterol/gamma-HCH transport system substrate-binding protein
MSAAVSNRKSFSERSPKIMGAVGAVVIAVIIIGALQFDKLPFLNTGDTYSADFAEAAGIQSGAPVQVAGLRVGEVSDVKLDGAKVRVTFTVDDDVRLGDRTEVAIKTKTLLGARMLSVSPRGDGHQSGPIPLDRTSSPYELPTALGELATTIEGIDTAELNKSLTTIAETFKDTPPALKLAAAGVARFSQSVNQRDQQLRQLLADANAVTGTLSKRSDELVSLLGNSNALLAQLRTQSAAIEQLSGNISALAAQLSGLVADNRGQLGPALDKLNNILTTLEANKENLQKSLRLLSQYSLSLGESVASAPFFKGYMSNLLPGQFIQPFIDAAFSDLGLDPATALPSQLTDPQVGQQATPALPIPFPRTGQGGDPRLTIPDAITGNPGDPRYPYREPPPQPPAGGPPPGPPEGFVPGAAAPEPASPTSVNLTPTPPTPAGTP